MTYNYFKWDDVFNPSYAQEGEDIVLLKLFSRLNRGPVLRSGFFVDVGAHHPVRYSNTCLYYKRYQWTGVNIDPNPGFKTFFDQRRPADVNLEMGIGPVKGAMEFHLFDDPALNTFDAEYAELVKSWKTRQYLGSKLIEVDTLASVLDRHAGERVINLLSVDAEGYDLTVLQSNDWCRYRPQVVLTEALDSDLEELMRSAAHLFMRDQGYSLQAKTISTGIYLDNALL